MLVKFCYARICWLHAEYNGLRVLVATVYQGCVSSVYQECFLRRSLSDSQYQTPLLLSHSNTHPISLPAMYISTYMFVCMRWFWCITVCVLASYSV